MKWSIAVLMSIVFVFGLTSCSGNGDYSYKKNPETGGITIVEYKGSSSEVIIPDTIDGKLVTGIGEKAFGHNHELMSVTIPESVKSIGDSAFSDCVGLISVEIPGSVETIGWGAFWYCGALKSVTIHDGVTDIGDDAFEGCAALEDVLIPGSVKSVGKEAFRECASLTQVIISEGVEIINDNAFRDCVSLTSVTIPNSVTHIEGGQFSAFSGCPSLTATYKGKEYIACENKGYVMQNDGSVGYYVDPDSGAKLGGGYNLPYDFYRDINEKS